MGHNLHGDVSTEDLRLAEEFLEMEAHFDQNVDHYLPHQVARIFVCLAHDWYELGDDEKGYDLLQKANKVCPRYFENQIKNDINEDSDFAYLIESLTNKILAVARSVMGE